MNNETDFKNVFCESARKQGGYTFKIAMSTVSGLPDLYCAMPGMVPVLLEAKFIKGITSNTFCRKIPYRAMQKEIMRGCNRPNKNKLVAYGLIGIKIEDKVYYKLMNPAVQIITNGDIVKRHYVVDNFINVSGLLIESGVPFMKQCGCDITTKSLLDYREEPATM